MKLLNGNLWDFHSTETPICITTNGVIKRNGELVMGAGIALQAKLKFPQLPFRLAEFVKQYGNRVFYCRTENLFSFPTKQNWRNNSDINLITQSAHQLSKSCTKFGFNKIYLPKPGCNHGNLSWTSVKQVIDKILDDRFSVVIQNNPSTRHAIRRRRK